jgi:hypothetical protein
MVTCGYARGLWVREGPHLTGLPEDELEEIPWTEEDEAAVRRAHDIVAERERRAQREEPPMVAVRIGFLDEVIGVVQTRPVGLVFEPEPGHEWDLGDTVEEIRSVGDRALGRYADLDDAAFDDAAFDDAALPGR